MAAREQPCPYRIVDDFGGAFSMGCVAGVIWNLGKGMYRAPKSERLMGGFRLLAKRAPILGGSFALWGGIFSLTDCAFTLIRRKQSPLNQIAAGFITGGVLAVRGKQQLTAAGPRVALRNAMFGGLILSCIQIIEVVMIKTSKKKESERQIEQQEKQLIEERKKLSKVRPDLFSNEGKILRVRV